MKDNHYVIMYRWEQGQILEQKTLKSDAKGMTAYGWRKDPHEAMLSKLQNKRYNMTNELDELIEKINIMMLLEDDLKNLDNESYNKHLKLQTKENPCGLSVSCIDRTINALQKLKENNQENEKLTKEQRDSIISKKFEVLDY